MDPERQSRTKALLRQILALPVERREESLAEICQEDEALRLEVSAALEAWQEEVESLFHQALPLAPKERERLMGTCDEDKREEVLSLLSSYPNDDKFLISPFLSNPPLKAGDQIGEYEILDFIGKGSMGDVYSARPPRLPGRVAIKILAKHLINDPGLIARFKAEAEIADSLAHPHILKVFDRNQQGDIYYIVSEFIDGFPLRKFIGQLPLSQALDYARQVGEALEAAHDAGIIHRDIKPENIMVLKGEKHIKVLDFGLAKLVNLPRSNDSVPGMAMGTLDYMSPEARKGQFDPCTDIWSWSVMTYEMVTGQLPHVASSIRRRPSYNKSLNSWMAKALSPRLEERYQSMRNALEDLPVAGDPSIWQKWWKPAIAFVILLTGLIFYWWWIDRPQIIIRVNSLTSSGNIQLAAISADGKYAAYATTASGGQTLKILQIDSPQERILVPVNPGKYIGITISPDNRYVYYVRAQREGSVLYRVSSQGGDSKFILNEVDTGISFSPDGKQIAFLRGHPGAVFTASVVLARLDGPSIAESQRELPALRPSYVYFLRSPLWSPDGLSVLCATWSNSSKGVQISAILITDGQVLHQVSQPWYRAEKPVWLKSGRSLAVVAKSVDSGNKQLLEMSWPDGKVSPWGHELEDYSDLDGSSGSQQIITVHSVVQNSLWLIPLTPAGDPKKVDVPAEFDGLNWIGSSTLVSEIKLGRLRDLWSLNPDTLETHTITDDNFTERDPVASPDGKYLVYISNRDGTSNLWRLKLADGSAIRLTSGSSVEKHPTITPDSQWVIYSSSANGGETLWIVPIDGGKATQFTDRPARNPVISPDGKKILCEYSINPTQGWSTVTLDRTTAKLVETFPDIPEDSQARWSADGTEIFYVVTNNDVSQIRRQWADSKSHGGNRRPLPHFTQDVIYAIAPSPDGRYLACIRGKQSANAVLIETARWPRTYF